MGKHHHFDSLVALCGYERCYCNSRVAHRYQGFECLYKIKWSVEHNTYVEVKKLDTSYLARHRTRYDNYW